MYSTCTRRFYMAVCGVIWLIYFSLPTYAQSPIPGDRMPPIEVRYTEGGVINKLDFADLKGQIIILDFWNIWCRSCILSMPKLNALQKKYSDKIKIILVTSNTKEEVENIFRLPYLKGVELSSITDDSVLVKLFPHKTVPHHVWILPNGVVQYITESVNANEDVIENVISKRYPKLYWKNDLYDLDFSRPLWSKENEVFASEILYYSYLSNRLKHYSGGGMRRIVDSISGAILGIRMINETILSMYQVAFGGFNKGNFQFENRILIDVKRDPIGAFKTENIFCYELKMREGGEDKLYSLMQQDLKRYFPYKASVEKMPVKCLAIIRTTDSVKIKSKGGKTINNRTEHELLIINMPIQKSLFRQLQVANAKLALPIIDLTDYKENIDLHLKSSLTDLPNLRLELQKHELDLVEQTLAIEMLVIKD